MVNCNTKLIVFNSKKNTKMKSSTAVWNKKEPSQKNKSLGDVSSTFYEIELLKITNTLQKAENSKAEIQKLRSRPFDIGSIVHQHSISKPSHLCYLERPPHYSGTHLFHNSLRV